MEDLDYWRLCDNLTIVQAALLIAGEDPSNNGYIEHWETHKRPKGYEAAKAALRGAIFSNEISSTEVQGCNGWLYIDNESSLDVLQNGGGWLDKMITVKNLKTWLASRGFATGFFFPDKQHNVAYLDESHPQYAPKLAVAIMAWEAVTQNNHLLNKKTPKQAIECWLDNNATKYSLSNTAIEEIAKIANWSPKGGVPSTASNITETSVNNVDKQSVHNKDKVFDLDSEMPF